VRVGLAHVTDDCVSVDVDGGGGGAASGELEVDWLELHGDPLGKVGGAEAEGVSEDARAGGCEAQGGVVAGDEGDGCRWRETKAR
jgi:hypothetical protein